MESSTYKLRIYEISNNMDMNRKTNGKNTKRYKKRTLHKYTRDFKAITNSMESRVVRWRPTSFSFVTKRISKTKQENKNIQEENDDKREI